MTPRPLRIPEVLTAEELKALLAQPNKRYPTGLRNLCMLRLMADLGLRSSEVLDLKVDDIDWNSGRLAVRQGKGGKDRVLWLSPVDLNLLRGWRERKPESCYLFTTLSGGRLQARYLRAMVAREAEAAGIGKRVHPHTLRHTFATDLYRQTKDLRLVQKALGHASITTTTIYTHLVDDDLESALKGLTR